MQIVLSSAVLWAVLSMTGYVRAQPPALIESYQVFSVERSTALAGPVASNGGGFSSAADEAGIRSQAERTCSVNDGCIGYFTGASASRFIVQCDKWN